MRFVLGLLVFLVILAFGFKPDEKNGGVKPKNAFGQFFQDFSDLGNDAVRHSVRTEEKVLKAADENLVKTFGADKDSGLTYDQLHPPKVFKLKPGVIVKPGEIDSGGWTLCSYQDSEGRILYRGVVDSDGSCIQR